MLRKLPLIVILGSTGTGKTKLSLQLAERFGGEIISADSMQVYANLNIVTAKATKEEQSRVKHHLLDVATPAEPFTVVQFRNAALPIIEKLLSESKVPIIVGGTNYYIESLLWNTLISPGFEQTHPGRESNRTTRKLSTESDENVSLSEADMAEMPSESLHKHLKSIDPETANRIHPNNKRKIIRAIDVYQQTGQTLSSKIHEQRNQPGGSRLGGPLRYPHIVLLWLRCNQDVLNARLDQRVDAMLEQGLLAEIRAFHNQHKTKNDGSISSSSECLYTKGVLQTIGFKEFIPYLEQYDAASDLIIEEYLRTNAYKMPTAAEFKVSKSCKDGNNKSSIDEFKFKSKTEALLPVSKPVPLGLELLNSCLNELKLVTRRYSKKQIKWIQNRFLGCQEREVPDLYQLDTSDVEKWNEEVFKRAELIIDCYQKGVQCELEPMAKMTHPGEGLNEETSNFCEICERHFIGEFQWLKHLSSNKHKKRKDGLLRKHKLAKMEKQHE